MERQTPLRKRKVREEKKPACDECRAQKLRCDAFQDYSRPCSRCVRRGVECVVPEERRKKPSPQESDEMQATFPPPPDSIPRSELGSLLVPSSESIPTGEHPPPSPSNISSTSPFTTNAASKILPHSESGFPERIEPKSRTIGNVSVDAMMIDICFARFDRYYAPLVPILTTRPSPNEVYHESILKFWVIVTIGSRTCPEDPTLFSRLSHHVETLALTSLCPAYISPYPIIEALLLMSTWNLSTDKPFYTSVYFTISSAVVTLSLQAGLHRCLGLQAVFPDRPVHAPEIARGTTLWAYSVISNQCAMAINGFPVNDRFELSHLSPTQECCQTVPSTVMLRQCAITTVIKAHHVMSDLRMEHDASAHDRALMSMISAFETELLSLKESGESKGPLDKLHLAAARLQIRSLAFFLERWETGHVELTRLFNAALTIMDTMSELQDLYQISFHCPDYVFQAMVLAACTLVKLMKTHPAETFRERDGTKALFAAIHICKDVSVMNNDIPARVSQILSQLWSSDTVYRDPDGCYIRALQIRNRLSASVVFDSIYWWRQLRQGSMSQQQLQSDPNNGSASEFTQHATANSMGLPYFDDSWSWDIDWGLFGSLNGIP